MKRYRYRVEKDQNQTGYWRIERQRLGACGSGKYGIWDSHLATTYSKRFADLVVRLLNAG